MISGSIVQHVDQLERVSTGSSPTRRCSATRVYPLALWACLIFLVPLMLAVGCATVSHNTVPKDLVSQATVVDMPNIRAWEDMYSTVLQHSLAESIHQARAIDPRGVVDTTGYVDVRTMTSMPRSHSITRP
jgi:hypothetical protein